MSALKNMQSNISPKARLMMGLTVVAVILAIGFTAMRLGSDKGPQGEGMATLQDAPQKSEISKDGPLDAIVFDKDSNIGQLYKKDEEEKGKKAEESRTLSHVDALKIQINEDRKPPTEPVKPDVNQQARLDALLAERRQMQQANQSRGQAQQAGQQQTGWEEFLNKELSFATAYTEQVQGIVASIRERESDVPKAAFEIGPKRVVEDEQADEASLTAQNESGGFTGYRPFIPAGRAAAGANLPEDADESTAARRQTRSTNAIQPTRQTQGDYPSARIAQASMRDQSADAVVRVGETHYSVLQIGVNTDELSPVRAVVVGKGILEGAVLVGDPVRVGEKAQINFTKMNHKGRSFSISAIALDTETYRSVLADDVDHHTVERYTKLFVATFADGFASALSDTNTVRSADGSQSTTTTALPDTKSQALKGLGNVGEKMTPIYEREFNRAPTVTVYPNREIVVMFMSELDMSDE